MSTATPEILDIYPLSPMQQGMLFHALSEPGSGVYIEQFTCRIRGRLDPGRFLAAWQIATRRHDALRTGFVWEGQDQPLQYVLDQAEIVWDERSWRHLDEAEQRAALDRFLEEDRTSGFDLAGAPLHRAALFDLAPGLVQFTWTFHHLVLDGWSMFTVLADVFRHYNDRESAAVTGPPTARYRDYIEWLGSRPVDEAREFWARYLAGAQPLPPLVAPRRSDRTRSEDYVRTRRQVSRVLLKALEESGRRLRVTTNTLLQGAWSVLLAEYSGESDVVFGATFAGRPPDIPGAEQIAGLFINTLPVRVRVDPDLQTADLLRRIQEDLVSIREYEHSPLWDVQAWAGSRRGVPLFQTIQVLENYPRDFVGTGALGDTEILDVTPFEKTSYPITLVGLLEEGLRLELWHDVTQLSERKARRILADLEQVLEKLADPNATRMADLRLARSSVPRELSRAADASPDLLQRFRDAVERWPDALAVRDSARALRYRELDERARAVGALLAERGLGPGDRVGLCLARSCDLAIGVLACLYAGVAFVPLDPSHPRDRLVFTLSDAGASACLASKDVDAAGLSVACPVLGMSPSAGPSVDWPSVCASDLAYVVYTSGSTGRPKGVAVEHAQIRRYVDSALSLLAPSSGDRFAMVSSLATDLCQTVFLPSLCSGGCLTIVDEVAATDPAAVRAILEEHRIDYLKIVPSHLAALAQPDAAGLLPAKALLLGGETSSLAWVDSLRALAPRLRIVNHYGPTETTVGVLTCELDAVDRSESGTSFPIGVPLPGVRAYVVDEALEEVPVGVPGELCIAGETVARGYVGRPEENAERFVADPFAGASERMYRTGDRVRRLDSGQIEFIGRVDRQVRVRGYRVELDEVEEVMRSHDLVGQAVAMVSEDEDRSRLALHVVPDPERWAALKREELARHGSERVSEWQRIYEDLYGGAGTAADARFETVGWNSSYSGEAIPASEMRESVETTVDRIASLGARSVLEIGCGSGLLLSRLAPKTECYVGTDLSKSALGLASRAAAAAGLSSSRVQLLEREATDFSGFEAGSFDLVLLNSVVQYFPSALHLASVFEEAQPYVAHGGRVFVGDVRNHDLLAAFHSSVLAARSQVGTSTDLLAAQLQRRIMLEGELLLSPGFFDLVASRLARPTRVCTELKRGHSENELVAFRYDVTVSFDASLAPRQAASVSWSEFETLDALDRRLAADPADVVVTGIPNERVRRAVHLRELIESHQGRNLAALLEIARNTAPGVDPEVLWSLGQRRGRPTQVTWCGAGGAMAAHFGMAGERA